MTLVQLIRTVGRDAVKEIVTLRKPDLVTKHEKTARDTDLRELIRRVTISALEVGDPRAARTAPRAGRHPEHPPEPSR